MRTLLMGGLLLSAFAASAQQIDIEQLRKKYPNLKWDSAKAAPLVKRWQESMPGNGAARPLMVIPKNSAPGVYSLAIDRMPCVVPDTKGIAAIPNPGLGYKHPKVAQIPNKGLYYNGTITVPPAVR